MKKIQNEKVSENILALTENLHSIHNTVETVSGNTKVATEFLATIKVIIERANFPLELVFNVDETDFFLKRIPKRTFLSCEEKRAPGF